LRWSGIPVSERFDDEQIDEGDEGDELVDVWAEQGPVDWSEQPYSDDGLRRSAWLKLGL
jgi:hypothetical protein